MRKGIDDLDDILEEIGEFGIYQISILLLLCLPITFAASNSFSYVFTAGVPKYRCFIPECEDPYTATYDAPWTSWAIPPESSENQVIGVQSDTCSRYLPTNVSELNSTICSKNSFTNTIETCTEWIFDGSERTIVNDWNITCLENQWKISLVGTAHFTGIIIATVTCGLLADKYGRKVTLIIFTFLMSLTGALQVLSPEYVTFVVFTFISSLATAAVYPLAFILIMEMVGKSKRGLPCIVLNCFYSVGEAVVAPIAWYTRDWVQTQLIVSVPAIVFLAYHWIIPESVRWLLVNMKREEAKKIMLRAAKFNQVTLSDAAIKFIEDDSLNETEDSEKDTMWSVIKGFMTSRKLIIRFLMVYFIWGVISFVYYGLSINSTSLGGNKYLNFSLVALAEIPGVTLSWIIMQTLGRRISLVGSLLLSGVTCIVTIFINGSTSNWAVLTFFLIGKIGISSAFSIVYVHTAELFPTIIRSGGVGSASTVARVGALLAPFAPLLGLFFNQLPMIVFGSVAILAGLLATRLPETLGRSLPETVQEAKAI
ncbi:organic cation transporter protein [Leptinotarsa decemlineata]|uniref:organic cation transporter protein n=1 Tax=Leptinotarsa decemlineata TaxID=7539 RepID=UPI003D305291